MKILTKEIRDLISKGDLDEAIDLLNENASKIDSSKIQNTITLLSARNAKNRHNMNVGIISNAEFQLENNRITNSTIDITYEIEERYGEIVYTNPDGTVINAPADEGSATEESTVGLKFTKMKWWQGVLAFGVIIGIISGIFAITGYSMKDFFGEPAPPKNLQLTVYVHGPNGKQDIVLENEGQIIADIGNDRRDPMVGEDGKTNMGEIPRDFINKSIPITLKSDNYVAVNPDSSYLLDGKPVYIEIKPNCPNCRIVGIIKKENAYVNGLTVRLPNQDLTAVTDENGRFEFNIPANKSSSDYALSILEDNKIIWDAFITPHPSKSSEIVLKDQQEYCIFCSAKDSYGRIVNAKKACNPDKLYLKNYISGFSRASKEGGRVAKCVWNNPF